MKVKMSNIVNVDFKKKVVAKQPLLVQPLWTKEEIAAFYLDEVDPIFYNMQQCVDFDVVYVVSTKESD